MLADGRYTGRAQEWGLGLSSNNNVQISVRFAFKDENGANQGMTWFGSFTEGALKHTLKALRAMGWCGSDPVELDGNGGGLDTNEVELVLRREEYNGETRTKIAFVNAIGGGLILGTPLDPAGKAKFRADMKGRILMLDQSSGGGHQAAPAKPKNGVKPSSGAVSTPPLSDDDIPF